MIDATKTWLALFNILAEFSFTSQYMKIAETSSLSASPAPSSSSPLR
jgi:hypothetical protein